MSSIAIYDLLGHSEVTSGSFEAILRWWKAICKALMVNTTLTDLSIGANGLGLIFAKSLSATLANNSTLQTMNIGMSFFDSNLFQRWFYTTKIILFARRQYGVGVSMHA